MTGGRSGNIYNYYKSTTQQVIQEPAKAVQHKTLKLEWIYLKRYRYDKYILILYINTVYHIFKNIYKYTYRYIRMYNLLNPHAGNK